jgi:hypothetical protein
MASANYAIVGPIRPYEALKSLAAASPDRLALRHKRRGDWLTWQWAAMACSVEGLAKSLSSYGLSKGDRIALVGEITPSLLFAALAADALGSGILLLPPTAKAPEILAANRDHPPRLAIIQGHESLGLWLQLRPQLGSVQIIFDHAAPGKRHDSSVVFFNDLLTDASSRHGSAAPRPLATAKAPSQPALWVESTTAWPDALAAISDLWLRPGTVLALPEMLAAAARDRVEVRPSRWLASGTCFAKAAHDIAHRLPLRLTASQRVAPISLFSGLLRQQARSRLGLANLTIINTEPAVHQRDVFSALGIVVRPWSKSSHERTDIAHHEALQPGFTIAESLS